MFAYYYKPVSDWMDKIMSTLIFRGVTTSRELSPELSIEFRDNDNICIKYRRDEMRREGGLWTQYSPQEDALGIVMQLDHALLDAVPGGNPPKYNKNGKLYVVGKRKYGSRK